MVCPKCGRVLVDGEICPCELEEIKKRQLELTIEELDRQEQEEKENAEKERIQQIKKDRRHNLANNYKEKTAKLSTGIFKDIISILSSPKEGIKNFVEKENVVNAGILIGLQSVIIGILISLCFSVSNIGAILSLLSKVNGFLVWLMITLTAGIGALANVLGFMIISKMDRNSLSFSQSLCLSAPKAVIMIPILILGILFMAINGLIGIAFLMMAIIGGVCFDSIGFRLINLEPEREAYYLMGVHFISTLATLIMVLISFSLIF